MGVLIYQGENGSSYLSGAHSLPGTLQLRLGILNFRGSLPSRFYDTQTSKVAMVIASNFIIFLFHRPPLIRSISWRHRTFPLRLEIRWAPISACSRCHRFRLQSRNAHRGFLALEAWVCHIYPETCMLYWLLNLTAMYCIPTSLWILFS